MKDQMENMMREMSLAIKDDLFVMLSKEAQYESSKVRAVSEVIGRAREVILKEKEIKNLMMK